MGVKDVTTEAPTAILFSGEDLITERAVYGLPRINAIMSDTYFSPSGHWINWRMNQEIGLQAILR